MRAKAELLLSTVCDKQPHAQDCTDYGRPDRMAPAVGKGDR